MKFRRFELAILIIILLIIGASLMLAWAVFSEHLKFSRFYFAGAIIGLGTLLFVVIYKDKKRIFEYLENLKFEDSLREMKTKNTHNPSIDKLYNLINEVARKYSYIKTEKESQHQYFQSVIKYINIGILSFDEKGKVELINDALLKILSLDKLDHIEELQWVKKGLPNILLEIKTNKHQLLRIEKNKDLLNLSLTASEFVIQGKKKRLITIQDIRNELQEEEIDAQQKLIRVLTHEIMNSVSPVTSLSSTLLEEINTAKLDDSEFSENMKTGLSAIYKRSEGLGKFVETYRNISKLPEPNFKEVLIMGLFMQIKMLFKDTFEQEHIEFSQILKDDKLSITADEKMIAQVIINIIKNAIEALNNTLGKKIAMDAFEDFNSNIHIRISNNGVSIPSEALDKIFLPFFSTKENGSGIGLSLSRQIMHLHRGTINMKSESLTVFQLIF